MSGWRAAAITVFAIHAGVLAGCERPVSAAGEYPCLLEFERTGVTLRADDLGSVPDPRPPIARGPDGRFYTWTYTPGEIAEWSEEGDFIRTIGGYGQGPGELQGGILTTMVDDDGGIHVLDTATGYWSRFTSAGEFVGRGTSLLFRFAIRPHVTLVGRDSIFMGYPVFGDSEHQFHIVGADGRVLAEFGDLPGDLGVDFDRGRAVAYTGGRTIWTAPWAGGLPDGYVLEEWKFSGTVRSTIHRDVPWFPTEVTGEVNPEAGRIAVQLPRIGVFAGHDGQLLSQVLLQFPEPDSGVSGEAWFEVIDPAVPVTLASRQVLFDDPGALPLWSVFPRTNMGYGLRTDEFGLQFVEIVRFVLRPSSEGEDQRCS